MTDKSTRRPRIPTIEGGASTPNAFLYRQQMCDVPSYLPLEAIERAIVQALVPGFEGSVAMQGKVRPSDLVFVLIVLKDIGEPDRQIFIQTSVPWDMDWFREATKAIGLSGRNIVHVSESGSMENLGVLLTDAEVPPSADFRAKIQPGGILSTPTIPLERVPYKTSADRLAAEKFLLSRDLAMSTFNRDRKDHFSKTLQERTEFAEEWSRLNREPQRFDFINACIEARGLREYLEIGVNNPVTCFDLIQTSTKWSVDPGLEYAPNPVDFPFTSDDFFKRLVRDELHCDRLPLPSDKKFDCIFIDGLHQAEQVERDIHNALRHIRPGGVIVLHDCLPPNEHCAVNTFPRSHHAVTSNFWPGSTWRAFERYVREGTYRAFVVDTDVGLGVIDTAVRAAGPRLEPNPYLVLANYKPALVAAGLLLTFDDAVAEISAVR